MWQFHAIRHALLKYYPYKVAGTRGGRLTLIRMSGDVWSGLVHLVGCLGFGERHGILLRQVINRQ